MAGPITELERRVNKFNRLLEIKRKQLDELDKEIAEAKAQLPKEREMLKEKLEEVKSLKKRLKSGLSGVKKRTRKSDLQDMKVELLNQRFALSKIRDDLKKSNEQTGKMDYYKPLQFDSATTSSIDDQFRIRSDTDLRNALERHKSLRLMKDGKVLHLFRDSEGWTIKKELT